MPSRAYTSFLLINATRKNRKAGKCQCPLGLISHFYHEYVIDEKWEVVVQCQCPLGLIPHFYVVNDIYLHKHFREYVNALSGLYLISTFRHLSCLM